jgi:hypothetical protein
MEEIEAEGTMRKLLMRWQEEVIGPQMLNRCGDRGGRTSVAQNEGSQKTILRVKNRADFFAALSIQISKISCQILLHHLSAHPCPP